MISEDSPQDIPNAALKTITETTTALAEGEEKTSLSHGRLKLICYNLRVIPMSRYMKYPTEIKAEAI